MPSQGSHTFKRLKNYVIRVFGQDRGCPQGYCGLAQGVREGSDLGAGKGEFPGTHKKALEAVYKASGGAGTAGKGRWPHP